MSNKKGIRTTITAYAGLVAGLAVVGMFLFGKIDTEQLTVSLATIGSFVGIIVGFFAKDSNKSHTQAGPIVPPPPPPPPPGDDPDQ